MLRLLLVFSCTAGLVFCTRCALCDSFQGYCDLEGSVCIGSLCASRIVTLEQGLVRVQKLCVPSDSPLGCHQTILWQGIQGRECVCEGDMCNKGSAQQLILSLLLSFLLI